MTPPSKEAQELRDQFDVATKVFEILSQNINSTDRNMAKEKLLEAGHVIQQYAAHHQAIVEIEGKIAALKRVKPDVDGNAYVSSDENPHIYVKLTDYIQELEQQKTILTRGEKSE